MKALYDALPHDAEHIDGFYKKMGVFYNSLSVDEKKIFHKNAQKAKASAPELVTLFNDPDKKAELEDYLKNKAGINASNTVIIVLFKSIASRM